VTKGSCAMRGLLHDPLGLFEALRNITRDRLGQVWRFSTLVNHGPEREPGHLIDAICGTRRLRRRGTASGAPALVPQNVDAIAFGGSAED
jgi:hypothetical protein